VATPFTPDDLRDIEKAMTKIIKERQRFRRRAVSDDQARAELDSEPYKLELITDKPLLPPTTKPARRWAPAS
jgi:threonyl-tRNA synthetase